jgi:hypothetical protein
MAVPASAELLFFRAAVILESMLHRIRIRKTSLGAICALALTCALPAAWAGRQDSSATSAKKKSTSATISHRKITRAHSSATAKPVSAKSRSKHYWRKKSKRLRGQQKIDSERATAIQEALIREHYLTGTATGKWDQASEDAMRRYQSDHGWQTKEVPDSRALIKLGLGPSNDHLLNPESAMTSTAPAPRAQPVPAISSSLPTRAAPTSIPASTQTPAPTATPTPASTQTPTTTATPTPAQADPTNPQ